MKRKNTSHFCGKKDVSITNLSNQLKVIKELKIRDFNHLQQQKEFYGKKLQDALVLYNGMKKNHRELAKVYDNAMLYMRYEIEFRTSGIEHKDLLMIRKKLKDQGINTDQKVVDFTDEYQKLSENLKKIEYIYFDTKHRYRSLDKLYKTTLELKQKDLATIDEMKGKNEYKITNHEIKKEKNTSIKEKTNKHINTKDSKEQDFMKNHSENKELKGDRIVNEETKKQEEPSLRAQLERLRQKRAKEQKSRKENPEMNIKKCNVESRER